MIECKAITGFPLYRQLNSQHFAVFMTREDPCFLFSESRTHVGCLCTCFLNFLPSTSRRYEKFVGRIQTWWNKKNPFLVKESYFPKPESYFADNFDKDRIEEFHNGKTPEKMFSPTERSRMVAYILESTKYGDDVELIGKDGLISKGALTAAYPCHDGPLRRGPNEPATNNRQKLSEEWASFSQIFKYQPIHGIKVSEFSFMLFILQNKHEVK